MKTINLFMSKGRLRRIGALALVVILTTSSALLSVNVSAETVSWKEDISSSLSDGLDGLAVTAVGSDFITLEWEAFN